MCESLSMCKHMHTKEKCLKARRQRMVLLLATLLFLERRNPKKHPGRPYPVKYKKGKDFWKVVRKYSASHFKKAFRMTFRQFRTLVSALRPNLDHNSEMAEISSGSLQAEVKIALLLRILARASYHDLCLLYDIPPSSVYDLFQRTMNAITETFTLPGLPTDVEELKKMSLKFQTSRKGGSPIFGCVGALDGIAIKIRKPNRRHHPALYYCRKGFYAIPVQAMVDAENRFRCFSAVCVGSTHDSLSHSVSALGRYLAEGKLIFPFWIAADEAYVCTECLLTPFSNSQLDRSVLSKYKDSYNFFHSSLRMHVEQAFGQLVQRFGIFWHPLRFSLGTCTKVILVAMLLHNFCIDHSDHLDSNGMPASERNGQRNAFRLWYNRCRAEYDNHQWDRASRAISQVDQGMAKSKMRAEIVERLRAIQRTRPYAQGRFDAETENED